MYLISPKAFTLEAYFFLVHPLVTKPSIDAIHHASLSDDGNIRACVRLDEYGFRKRNWQDFEINLPLKEAINPKNPRYQAMLAKKVGYHEFYMVWLGKERMRKGCSLPTRRVLALIQSKSDFGRIDILPPKNLYGELWLTGYDGEIAFMSPKSFMTVTIEGDESSPEMVSEERAIVFRFKDYRMPFRWWNLWVMPLAIAADAITGPLGWIAFVMQHRH